MSKTILNYRSLSDHMGFMTKTKEDTNVTYYIGMAYIETETKLSDLLNRVWYVTRTKQKKI